MGGVLTAGLFSGYSSCLCMSPFVVFFKRERIPRLKMITCASTEAFFSEVFQPRDNVGHKRVGSKRVKGATGCERETAFKEVQREGGGGGLSE